MGPVDRVSAGSRHENIKDSLLRNLFTMTVRARGLRHRASKRLPEDLHSR